jgi:PAS domain S-box-containing protein
VSKLDGPQGPRGDRTPELEGLVERLERREKERALLDRVRSALEGELDLTAVCRKVVHAVADSYGYSLVSVYLLHGEVLELQEQVGYPVATPRIPAGGGAGGRVIRSGVSLLLEGAEGSPPFLVGTPGVSSAVCVPLRERGRVVGVLNVESVGTRLATEDLDLLEALSQHLSAALSMARLHTRLRRSEEQYRSLLESQGEGVVTVDHGDRFLFANPAAERILGVTRGSLPGRFLAEFLDDGQRAVLEGQSAVLRSGRSSVYELEIIQPGGERRCLLVDASPVRGDDALFAGTLAVFWDYTDRKQVEDRLTHAMQAAEAASRAKSEFLSLVSHELRTPMTGVLGMLDLLLDTPLEGMQRQHAEAARRSARGLQGIIDNLIDLTKIEAGKLSLEQAPFSVRDCLETAVESIAAPLAAKGLTLERRIDPAVPPLVVGDMARLRQVISALLSNAVKFTERGTVEAVVERLPAPPGALGRVVLAFTVRDTGIGIPPALAGRLFQPFGLLDSSRSRAFGGMGLGLVICRRLCELMDGDIGVESEGVPGRGSAFRFTIQAAVAEEAATAPRLRVLVADDEPVNRKLMAVFLERLGHRAEFAADGGEALAMAGRTRYDVVLMDVHMPVLDGLEATRRMRAELAPEARPYIIAITGSAMAEDLRICIEAGMDDCLPKPIRLGELARALGKRPAAAPPVPAPAVSPDARPTLDPRALTALLGQLGPGAKGAVRELIGLFLSGGRTLGEDLARGLAGQDTARLHLAAHSLKSSAASVGAERLRFLCERLEADVRAAMASGPGPGAWKEWELLVEGVAAETGRAAAAAEAWAASMPA